MLGASIAQAQITPSGTFQPLPGDVNFSGSGIPGPVMGTTLGNGVRLYLGASQRFGNPALGNNGAGTYYASAGGDVLNAQPTFAQWNFNFFIGGDANTSPLDGFGAYDYRLFYDFTRPSVICNRRMVPPRSCRRRLVAYRFRSGTHLLAHNAAELLELGFRVFEHHQCALGHRGAGRHVRSKRHG